MRKIGGWVVAIQLHQSLSEREAVALPEIKFPVSVMPFYCVLLVHPTHIILCIVDSCLYLKKNDYHSFVMELYGFMFIV